MSVTNLLLSLRPPKSTVINATVSHHNYAARGSDHVVTQASKVYSNLEVTSARERPAVRTDVLVLSQMSSCAVRYQRTMISRTIRASFLRCFLAKIASGSGRWSGSPNGIGFQMGLLKCKYAVSLS